MNYELDRIKENTYLINGVDSYQEMFQMKLDSGETKFIDFVADNNSDDAKFLAAIREHCENGHNYGATESVVFTLKTWGQIFLIFLHNGKPFDSFENMAKCINIGVSNSQGSSRFGGGGKISSLMLSPLKKESAIMGSVFNGQFRALLAKRQRADNSFPIVEVTNSLVPALETVMCGKLSKYNVFYASPICDKFSITDKRLVGISKYVSDEVLNKINLSTYVSTVMETK